MQPLYWILSLFILCSCKDDQQLSKPPQKPSEAPTEASIECITEEHVTADFAKLLAPLIDPAKLDTLKGKRAAA